MEQQVQRAIAHKLCDYAEELGLVADAKDLDDVVEPGFVKDLCLLQQAIPLSETQPAIQSQSFLSDSDRNVKIVMTVIVLFVHSELREACQRNASWKLIVIRAG